MKSRAEPISHFPTATYQDFAELTEESVLTDPRVPKDHEPSPSNSQTFPTRLHYMLSEMEKDGMDDIMCWQSHGRSFIIKNQQKLETQVLPSWFRQSKFTSFQRQLHFYGFNLITAGPDAGGYYHELFLRGKQFLAKYIYRFKGKRRGRPKTPKNLPNLHAWPALPPTGNSTPVTHKKDVEMGRLAVQPNVSTDQAGRTTHEKDSTPIDPNLGGDDRKRSSLTTQHPHSLYESLNERGLEREVSTGHSALYSLLDRDAQAARVRLSEFELLGTSFTGAAHLNRSEGLNAPNVHSQKDSDATFGNDISDITFGSSTFYPHLAIPLGRGAQLSPNDLIFNTNSAFRNDHVMIHNDSLQDDARSKGFLHTSPDEQYADDKRSAALAGAEALFLTIAQPTPHPQPTQPPVLEHSRQYQFSPLHKPQLFAVSTSRDQCPGTNGPNPGDEELGQLSPRSKIIKKSLDRSE